MEADGSETLYKINVVVSDSILRDVNCDGALNVTNCTEIQRYIIGAQEFTAEQTVLADFDKNGSITVADVTEIQKSIVGA
ncbi:MAG: dockerin type I repeat-containing protein [Clostridiales bacterium]|nr:dockerin type I repeat-containing protein [Clostridiales bacterium]